MNRNIETFIACDKEYAQADIVLFGAPFDGTTSYRPGTRFGPSAMRSQSEGIETYSPYQNRDLNDINVCDVGDLELPFGNTQQVIDLIEQRTSTILTDDKLPIMLGGEHLASLGALSAVAQKYPEVHILHLDAHADLRDDYLGQQLSHATVMRRIWELVGDGRIYQYGIRSGDRSELEWGHQHVYTHMFDCNDLEYAMEGIGDKPVYLSIDLDVLDPSVFPGTGTPEPGGISFIELLESILQLSVLNIVGADLNELSPHYDQSGMSTIVACKTLRELLLAIE